MSQSVLEDHAFSGLSGTEPHAAAPLEFANLAVDGIATDDRSGRNLVSAPASHSRDSSLTRRAPTLFGYSLHAVILMATFLIIGLMVSSYVLTL